MGGLVASVVQAFASGFGMFGKGRKEADIIVPVVNSITQRVSEIESVWDQSSVEELTNFYNELQAMQAAFNTFTYDPRFTDGRASKQARDGFNPFLEGIKNGIIEKLQVLGASPGLAVGQTVTTAPTTSGAYPVSSGAVWANGPMLPSVAGAYPQLGVPVPAPSLMQSSLAPLGILAGLFWLAKKL